VWIPEPFLSMALGDPDKYTVIGYPNQETIPGLPTMVTFTSGAVSEDAELLEAWRGAVADTLAAATDDREGFGQTIAEFTGMPEAAAANLRLERLDAELDPQLITDLSDLAQKFEFIEKAPDLGTVILD
jgi:NitT/TauT family transport system substrate-binding protein